MMHKFPFAILHIRLDPALVDVNVHPAKLEVRFGNQPILYEAIRTSVENVLSHNEMIPDALLDSKEDAKTNDAINSRISEMKDLHKENEKAFSIDFDDDKSIAENVQSSQSSDNSDKSKEALSPEPFEKLRFEEHKIVESKPVYAKGVTARPIKIEDSNKSAVWTRVFGDADGSRAEKAEKPSPVIKGQDAIVVEKPMQLNLFDEKVLTKDNVKEYEILGQIFGTYWIISFKDKIFLVDQHAAHEKVNYERMMKRYKSGDMLSQMVNPPVILTLSAQEEEMFLNYRQYFEKLGFNIENFGGHEYAMRAIPIDLFGCSSEKEMFLEILDELTHETNLSRTPDVINYKIAGMACKASVKGNSMMTKEEMEVLLDELLTLDNPYNCPHGRPTIISMSKYEIDKKFKRVVE